MVSEKILAELRKGKQSGLNLSFAGCGFLGIYHVGVASCLREHAPHLIADKISGASAGGLVACAMITGCCLGECTTFTLNVAMKARSRSLGPLHPGFNLVGYLEQGLHVFLPDNAHIICTGRLHLSLTRVSDRRNVLVSQYDSKEDLIQALICSAFVPLYCGVIPPKYKGVRYIDGGLSDNIPILDDNTISVSPFAGESDISPYDGSASLMHLHLAGTSIQCCTGNLMRFGNAFFPPEPEKLTQMCQRGYDDCLKFLQANTLISCPQHVDQVSIQQAVPDIPVAETISDFSSSISDADLMSMLDYEDLAEEEEPHICAECPECRHQLSLALGTSLPIPVTTALQSAVDSTNNGLLNNMYKFRVYKVLSLMATPYILPWEMAAILVKKFVTWAPNMPNDMHSFAHELMYVVKSVVDIVQKGRHRYSARFSCQLALTEVDYKKVAQYSDLLKQTCAQPPIDSAKQKQFGFSFAYNAPKTDHVPNGEPDNTRHSRSHVIDMDPTSDPAHEQTYPVKCHLHHWEGRVRRSSGASDVRSLRRMSAGSDVIRHEHHYSDVDPVNNLYDSFEHSLKVAQQMESMLSVYYGSQEDVITMKMMETT